MDRNGQRWASALFTSLVLLILPSGRAQEKKDELPRPKTLEELQQAMQKVLEKNHVPGVAVALISNGALLWCGGIGQADLAAKREVTCDTEFRVGSISKTFVALALLKLEEEGKINLHARLRDVAPEVPMTNPWEATNPVRVVNLLEHTAGFDEMEAAETFNLRDPYDYPLLEVFRRFRKPQDVRWRPGTRMSYSSPGYGIAGYLIQKITGQPYDQYIRQNILAALGITRGDFRLTDANGPLLAQGYDDNPPQPIPYRNIYLRPAGDMKASAGELAKLVQFFLRRGKAGGKVLFKPDTIERMELPETPASARNGLRLGYGLGNFTQLEDCGVTHGHVGEIAGFQATYRYMPEANWGYAVLQNSTISWQPLRELTRLAADFLSRDQAKLRPSATHMPAGELKEFAGFYAPRAPWVQLFAFSDGLLGVIHIRVINDQIFRSGMFDAPQPLLPAGKNLFRGENEPEASTVFFKDETGKMVMADAEFSGIAYAERIHPVWPCAGLALFVLCFFLMLTSLLFALAWIPRKLQGKMTEVRHLAVRSAPLLATLAMASVPYCFTRVRGIGMGTANPWTVGILFGSALFPIFSVIGLILALHVPKNEIQAGVRIHSLLVSIACCVVAGFLGSWHLIGLRLWAP